MSKKKLPEFAVIDFDKDACVVFCNAATPQQAVIKYLKFFTSDEVAGDNIMVIPTDKQTNFIGSVEKKTVLKYKAERCD